MRSTRTTLLGLSAVTGLALAAASSATHTTTTTTTATSTIPRRPTPKRFVNKDPEIQKWNEAVEQRKKARKGR